MTQPGGETKQRILNAAEQLFATRGIAATSLRSIIRDAGVNLASVHYHFGSKDALVNAVIARHFQPLNEERIRRLDDIERRAGARRPSIEKVVEAFVAPTLELCADPLRGKVFMRLLGRLVAEPEYFFGKVAPTQMAGIRDRFADAFARAVPNIDMEDIAWRMTFTVGAMAYSMRIGDSISALSGGRIGSTTTGELARRLVRFATAGWKASAD